MKDLREIKELIAEHRSELIDLYGIARIGVFGSYLRGEQDDLTASSSRILRKLCTKSPIIQPIGTSPAFEDSLVVDAALRNLQVIGEVAGKIPSEVRDGWPQLPWQRMIGPGISLLTSTSESISK